MPSTRNELQSGPAGGLAYRAAKRAFDIVASLLALLLLSPVLIVVAIAIRFRMGSPVLFVHERPGLAGVPFRMYKFRTMLDATGPDGAPLPDEARITGLGGWLRRSSLDEVPEFLNVLAGHMSMVGPRPLLVAYLPRYSAYHARRHEVRPGITGWAQVNGRNAIEWADKLDMDVWYVDHRSLGLDLKILWMTVLSVFRSEGISAEGHATMPEFLGEEARADEDVRSSSPERG